MSAQALPTCARSSPCLEAIVLHKICSVSGGALVKKWERADPNPRVSRPNIRLAMIGSSNSDSLLNFTNLLTKLVVHDSPEARGFACSGNLATRGRRNVRILRSPAP